MAVAAPPDAHPAPRLAPLRSPVLISLAAWLIPGAGHFLLGRRGRAAIILASITLMFLVGVMLNGAFFTVSGAGDILARLVQYAGLIGDVATGILYVIAVILGYNPPDQPGYAADYGAKFLVAAGVLNVLAIVDAYEIATRQKD